MSSEIKINILNNKIRLDELCWNCDGGTHYTDVNFVDVNGVCEPCNGTGYILTDAGSSIMELIERHSKKCACG